MDEDGLTEEQTNPNFGIEFPLYENVQQDWLNEED
jgi:hypothetical protein